MSDETITADDAYHLRAILANTSDRERTALVREYWRDAKRADRTPRSIASLHIAMLCATVDHLLDARELADGDEEP